MKDSRIGTFAALTLVIWTGVKASLLMAIIARAGAGYALLALIGTEAASRAGMLAFWHALPSRAPAGLPIVWASRNGKPWSAAAGWVLLSSPSAFCRQAAWWPSSTHWC